VSEPELDGDAPRVLLACDHFVRYTAGLAGGLAAAGCDVTLLTRSHELEFGGRTGALRDYVREVGGPHVRHEQLGRRVRDPSAIGELGRLARDLRRPRAQVVHVQESVANDPRLLIAGGARPRRLAVTIHDLHRHPGDRPRSPWNSAGHTALIRAARLLFVHADVLRDELRELHRPRAPIVVVPVGEVEPGPAAPLPGAPALLFFGRISHYKGIDTLLDAMPRVWGDLPATRLTIAGKGKLPDHDALADPRIEVRNEHVADSAVGELFARSTAVVLPYREASQSAVAPLAKRHSRPLVVSTAGGLAEVAADGSALTFPPEDAEALAARLVELLRDPDRAAEMGRRGARAMQERVGWPSVARATLAAYREHLL
jgi:glycosyltransferase involved in cell wall biosynthesis